MDQSTTALAYVLFALAAIIWAATEVTGRQLAEYKGQRWAQTVLHLEPLVLGVAICGTPDVLPWLMELCGYAPRHPPGVGASMMLGMFSGACSVLFHDKIGAVVEGRFKSSAPQQAPLQPVAKKDSADA